MPGKCEDKLAGTCVVEAFLFVTGLQRICYGFGAGLVRLKPAPNPFSIRMKSAKNLTRLRTLQNAIFCYPKKFASQKRHSTFSLFQRNCAAFEENVNFHRL